MAEEERGWQTGNSETLVCFCASLLTPGAGTGLAKGVPAFMAEGQLVHTGSKEAGLTARKKPCCQAGEERFSPTVYWFYFLFFFSIHIIIILPIFQYLLDILITWGVFFHYLRLWNRWVWAALGPWPGEKGSAAGDAAVRAIQIQIKVGLEIKVTSSGNGWVFLAHLACSNGLIWLVASCQHVGVALAKSVVFSVFLL